MQASFTAITTSATQPVSAVNCAAAVRTRWRTVDNQLGSATNVISSRRGSVMDKQQLLAAAKGIVDQGER
jgi:hypothetical protein